MKLYFVAHIDNHGNSTNHIFNELAICSSTNVTAMGLADKSADPKTKGQTMIYKTLHIKLKIE